ncbi:hypothetical protein S83_048458 [Arachis hypogaea]
MFDCHMNQRVLHYVSCFIQCLGDLINQCCLIYQLDMVIDASSLGENIECAKPQEQVSQGEPEDFSDYPFLHAKILSTGWVPIEDIVDFSESEIERQRREGKSV